MPTPVEEIKQKIDLIDFIQEYIRLTPAGSNFRAVCPFHREKTPSFMVSSEKQIWHCFGCGEGGDIFGFLMRMEGLDFSESLRTLAARAGVALTSYEPKEHSQRSQALVILQRTNEFFQKQLRLPIGRQALEYLQNRGITEETIQTWQFGYAPNDDSELFAFWKSQGFTMAEVEQAGVLASSGGRVRNRFWDRLIFPLFDQHGNVVSFAGRTLRLDGLPKYVNGPQSLVYNKSAILYGLFQAKTAIKRLGYAVLVEGYMDVLASFQAGTKNVLAVCGTALTEQQLSLLKRYTDNVMICFDADVAGQSANLRGLNLAWNLGFNLKIVNLGNSKDPDELIKKDPNLWTEALRQAEPLMDYVFSQTVKQFDLSRPDHKKKVAQKLIPYLNFLSDPVEQAHYAKKLTDLLGVPASAIQSLLTKKKPAAEALNQEITAATTVRPLGLERKIGERLLALLLLKPEVANELYLAIEPEMLIIEELIDLYKYLQIYYNENNQLPDEQVALQSSLGSESITALSLLAQTILAESPETINQELLLVARRLQQAFWQKKLSQIQAAIAQAEQQRDVNRLAILSQEYSVLTEKLK